MKIDFPCPATADELTPSANGVYCSYCAKEVVDVDGMTVDEVKELAASTDGLCVSTSKSGVMNTGYSVRKFALSLLVVFGSALFTFADAQVEEKVNAIKVETPGQSSIGLLQIVFVDQDGDTLSTSVGVSVELPNGKMLTPTLSDDDTYWVEIPAYAKGKSVVIHADRFGKKKKRVVYISGFGESLVEEIKFKAKRNQFPYRTMGCPSF